jgi:hypothetical protein
VFTSRAAVVTGTMSPYPMVDNVTVQVGKRGR